MSTILQLQEQLRIAIEKVSLKKRYTQKYDKYEKLRIEIFQKRYALRAESLDLEKKIEANKHNPLSKIITKFNKNSESIKERYLALKEELEICENEYSTINDKVTYLRGELDTLDNIDEIYLNLYNELKNTYLATYQTDSTLHNLDKKEKALLKNIQNLNEIKDLFADLKFNINNALKALSYAESQGTLDLYTNSILISDAKYDNINEAKKYLRKSQQLIDKLNLNHIEIPKIAISNTEVMADMALDSIFVDLSVQGTIKDSYKKTKKLKSSIKFLMEGVEEELNSNLLSLNEIHSSIEKLILNN